MTDIHVTDSLPGDPSTPGDESSADAGSPDSPTPADSSPASAASPTLAQEGTFTDLGVIAPIAEALADEGIVHPFPIQEQAIPIAVQGTDLIGQARTGTGKTFAFGVTVLQRITIPEADSTEKRLPQALILCPTRELALQVSGDLAIAGRRLGARVLTVYGGAGYEPQISGLADGVDVVVGTPGRLIDLLHRKNLVLSKVSVLVLDEADEMLDLGFLPDVEELVRATPASRQTLLFSATMPAPIMALARANLRQPVHIRAESGDESQMVPQTTQFVYQTHELDKPAIIAKLLQSPKAKRVIVFCPTKWSVQRLTDDLKDRGFSVTCIHGDLSQVLRERALEKFRSGKAQVIVATDVAARGIDIDLVTHVINYTCPDDEKTYIHRIGRTGRAGNEGVAITFVDWQDLTRWKVINKALGLDFPEPIEAYSTTPQLLEELEIPADAKARLVPEQPREPRERDSRGGRGDRDRGRRDGRGSDRGRGGDRGARAPRSGDRRTGRDRRDEDRAPAEDNAAPTTQRQERIERADRPQRSRVRRRNGEPRDDVSTAAAETPTGDVPAATSPVEKRPAVEDAVSQLWETSKANAAAKPASEGSDEASAEKPRRRTRNRRRLGEQEAQES
ncbi:MAG: DEAD/DEAH box helicase [Propionibacteriaceae bacterium]|jgi:superfamily II DNA/RNA helicase|nr:DEAD/DEAH box helicase [Propionibacteriaceae bacterium]